MYKKGRVDVYQSPDFFVKVKGAYALFTDPALKGGGEKFSYQIPTKQALIGIVDGIYFKPTFKNIVTEVVILNQIQTEVIGTRAMIGSSKKMEADLNYVSYLIDVEYLIRYHFVWDEKRVDLTYDRNAKKHEAIMQRSLQKGGRRDVFLGTRECVATAEEISQEEYDQHHSYYKNQTLSFGVMFQEFEYPTEKGQYLKSFYQTILMKDGVITFKDKYESEIVNELSNYTFKVSDKLKSAEEEFEEYQKMERR